MKHRNTLWQYVLDIVIILASAAIVTFVLLGLVAIFERCNIHVPGSREMWIGLIGAILGGAYTLLGVQITIRRQKESDIDQRRLENMPILQFKTSTSCMKNFDGQGIFTLSQDEFITTGFPKRELDNYPTIEISLASQNPAFDVHIDSCITTDHKKIPKKTEYYFPQEYRLVPGEKVLNMFWIQDYSTYPQSNVQGVMRFVYSDIFGNSYYQDVSFTYDEQLFDSDNMLKFERVLSPVLISKDVPTLMDRILEEYPHIKTNTDGN